MSKITITIECVDEEEALEVSQRLAGVTSSTTAPVKKTTPSQKAKAATKEACDAPDEPAEVKKAPPKKKKAKAKAAVTKEDVKSEIVKHAGDMNDSEVADRVKEYVNSFDVAAISKMDEVTLQNAFDGAEAYFAQFDSEDEDEAEDDPMA